jgi:hypothetical protein
MMLPNTLVQVRILRFSLADSCLEGELQAGLYQWTFRWRFRDGGLMVHPTQGRALVAEPLKRFLEQQDYALEVGEVYSFTLRTRL